MVHVSFDKETWLTKSHCPLSFGPSCTSFDNVKQMNYIIIWFICKKECSKPFFNGVTIPLQREIFAFFMTMLETPFLRSKTVNEIYETRPISNHQVIVACVPIDSQKIMSMQHVEKVVLNSTYYRRIF